MPCRATNALHHDRRGKRPTSVCIVLISIRPVPCPTPSAHRPNAWRHFTERAGPGRRRRGGRARRSGRGRHCRTGSRHPSPPSRRHRSRRKRRSLHRRSRRRRLEQCQQSSRGRECEVKLTRTRTTGCGRRGRAGATGRGGSSGAGTASRGGSSGTGTASRAGGGRGSAGSQRGRAGSRRADRTAVERRGAGRGGQRRAVGGDDADER